MHTAGGYARPCSTPEGLTGGGESGMGWGLHAAEVPTLVQGVGHAAWVDLRGTLRRAQQDAPSTCVAPTSDVPRCTVAPAGRRGLKALV
jgi:hypothetical protein